MKPEITYLDRIVAYMKKNRFITVRECQKYIGTTELRKMICELKDKGYTIGDVWAEENDRYGNTARFKRYFIIKTPNMEE